jgi:hypothetical protein
VNPAARAVVDLLRAFFADTGRWPRWPKPLHLLQGALLVTENRLDLASAARAVGTTPRHIEEVAASADPVEAVLKIRLDAITDDAIEKRRRNIGQLVLGRAAEIAFEDICRAAIDPAEFSLKDVREGRTNTDYRLLNGGARPLYRFNIKFVGAVFRRGAEMVGLEPADCFPLATYKIHAALQEQTQEHLPYVFAVVKVPDLNATAVAEAIPVDQVRPVAQLFASPAVNRKRDYEDWLVDKIVALRSDAFMAAYSRIRAAAWYVLSARRADRLLHERLFERVFALRIPGFTRQFGGAEVDMHFSLSRDLVTLVEFLDVLRRDGQGRVTSMLERGTY